jgi:hypothetical protein
MPEAVIAAVRETGCYGISSAGLLRLNVRELDHLRPLFGFLGDQLPKIGGRARKHRRA